MADGSTTHEMKCRTKRGSRARATRIRSYFLTIGHESGDHVITIDRGQSTESRIVVESRDRSLSTRAVYSELEAARQNRSAAASLAVFAKLEQSPMRSPIFLDAFGAIVALDGHNDQVLLRVAYEWSQKVATSKNNADSDLDLQAAKAAIDDLEIALNNTRSISAALNGIEKHLNNGRQNIDQMRTEVAAAANRTRQALGLT